MERQAGLVWQGEPAELAEITSPQERTDQQARITTQSGLEAQAGSPSETETIRALELEEAERHTEQVLRTLLKTTEIINKLPQEPMRWHLRRHRSIEAATAAMAEEEAAAVLTMTTAATCTRSALELQVALAQ